MHLSALMKQKPYEHVVYVLRRHWLTFMPTTVIFLVLLPLPWAVFFLFDTLFPTFLQGPLVFILATLVTSIYYVGTVLFFYSHFVEFYLDTTIITNDRVIDAEQHGLFSRSISEVDLYRVQDVTTNMHGFLATIFDYGDVIIKTASEAGTVVAQAVAHPNKIRKDLIHLSFEDAKFHPAHRTQAPHSPNPDNATLPTH